MISKMNGHGKSPSTLSMPVHLWALSKIGQLSSQKSTSKWHIGSQIEGSLIFNLNDSNLAPGGYFQCLESEILTIHCDDGSYDVDGPHSKYSKKLREAARKAGLIDIAPKLKQLMLEAGFTEVKEIRNRTPTNKWPKNPHMKHLGGLSAQILGMGLEAYGLALFTRYLSMDPEEAKVLIRNAVADITNPKCHAIINQCAFPPLLQFL